MPRGKVIRALDADINHECPLADAVQTHQAIESGATLGAMGLIP